MFGFEGETAGKSRQFELYYLMMIRHKDMQKNTMHKLESVCDLQYRDIAMELI